MRRIGQVEEMNLSVAWGAAVTETKPKRRWFRFSLRTLFVLVTITGVAAGWADQLNRIRQRHEFMKRDPVLKLTGHSGGTVIQGTPPWNLRLFGDGDYYWLGVTQDIERAKVLFPEQLDFLKR